MPLKLEDVNEFLCCKLCKGYLINATTLNDCCFDTCKLNKSDRNKIELLRSKIN